MDHLQAAQWRARHHETSFLSSHALPHFLLRHGRDVHPTWVKSSIETLSNTKGGVPGILSTRAKSEEDFDSY